MGCCFKDGLIQSLDNKTDIYESLSKAQSDGLKAITIRLEGDAYVMCPDPDRLIDTDSIYLLEDNLLTFLKDQTGIKTG